MKWAILASLLNVFSDLCGQGVITGIVKESGSEEPLPSVNVYLVSTSMGSVTGIDGRFSFKVNLPGKYNLVASFVGYSAFQIPIIIQSDSVYKLEISLTMKNFELRSVVIKADTVNRKKDFWEFKKMFLGETPNATRCHIRNPSDIIVYYDKSVRVLTAHARAPIEVENRALGYVLHYDLEKFEANYDSGTLHIWGLCRFEELHPASEGSIKFNWKINREITYAGSITHFMRAVLSNRLKDEGWDVNIIYPNLRPSDTYINEKIKSLKWLGQLDSLPYYQHIKLLPLNSNITSLLLQGNELVSKENPHVIDFYGTLELVYKKEHGTKVSEPQRSELIIIRRGLVIYDNGYYEPQNNIYVTGYLAKTERISELLPFDYFPEVNKKSKKGTDRSGSR